MRGGTFGRFLRVDVGSGEAVARPLDASALRAVVGGVGLGALLLAREAPAGVDPLAPEAPLVVAFGPLVGTPLTTSAKLSVVAKSPLTSRLCDALSSSSFAIAGKRTGHDALVFVGRAARPSILLVDDGAARVEACDDLWGAELTIPEVEAALRERHPGFAWLVVGIAGEHLVRYAGLGNDGRHAGRGGLGAVLGSKRVKAIGVRGSHAVPLADPARVVALAKDLARRSLGPATEKYRELGTVANLATLNRLAALPTRSFQASTFDGASELGGEALHATRARGRGSCQSCTIGCEHFFAVRDGEAPVKAEYESLFSLGPLCGIQDPAAVLAASRACDELGLDTISAGGTIAFAMECAERGLLGRVASETIGFGDGDGLLRLLHAIARRRGALADLLADGSRAAAARIGDPAPDLAPHVKGLEIPGYEPRALQTMALGLAVATRGADHNKTGAYEADLSGKVDRFAPDPARAGALAAETEERAALVDALILCKFLRGVFGDLFAESAELLAAVTGEAFHAAELHATARRIVLLKRAYNEREGFDASEDMLPARFFDVPLPTGVAKGVTLSRAGFTAMRAAYYAERGLDDAGRITRATWLDAGLEPLLGAAAPR